MVSVFAVLVLFCSAALIAHTPVYGSWYLFLFGVSVSCVAMNLCAGILAVPLTGYIITWTGSWMAVFVVAAFVYFIGAIVFLLFGSGQEEIPHRSTV